MAIVQDWVGIGGLYGGVSRHIFAIRIQRIGTINLHRGACKDPNVEPFASGFGKGGQFSIRPHISQIAAFTGPETASPKITMD